MSTNNNKPRSRLGAVRCGMAQVRLAAGAVIAIREAEALHAAGAYCGNTKVDAHCTRWAEGAARISARVCELREYAP